MKQHALACRSETIDETSANLQSTFDTFDDVSPFLKGLSPTRVVKSPIRIVIVIQNKVRHELVMNECEKTIQKRTYYRSKHKIKSVQKEFRN